MVSSHDDFADTLTLECCKWSTFKVVPLDLSLQKSHHMRCNPKKIVYVCINLSFMNEIITHFDIFILANFILWKWIMLLRMAQSLLWIWIPFQAYKPECLQYYSLLFFSASWIERLLQASDGHQEASFHEVCR